MNIYIDLRGVEREVTFSPEIDESVNFASLGDITIEGYKDSDYAALTEAEWDRIEDRCWQAYYDSGDDDDR